MRGRGRGKGEGKRYLEREREREITKAGKRTISEIDGKG